MSIWFSEDHTPNVRFSLEIDKELLSRESEYQKIEVLRSREFGRVLVLDGSITLTEKDEFIYHEMIVHVPMAVHPEVKRVLIVGGGDGGVLHQLVSYPTIEAIDMVEIDPLLVQVCKKFFPKLAASFSDPRVTVIHEDGLRYVRRVAATYDLIIVDSSDPAERGANLFSREFFGNCFKALDEDGIVVNQHESPFYSQDASMVQDIYRKTRAVFPIDRLYQVHLPSFPSGHWLFGFMSKTLDPLKDLDDERWNALGLKTRYYNTELHRGAFALPNYVQKLLKIKESSRKA